jgi:hypothetical protein
VVPGEAVDGLLVGCHCRHLFELVVEQHDAAVGESHRQQCLALDWAEGQRQRDILHFAADNLRDGRLATAEQVHFSGDRG